MKNVMAIAAGISDGLGLGYNARAALITRGLAEIARLGAAMGGQRRNHFRPDRRGRPDPHRDRRSVAQPARRTCSSRRACRCRRSSTTSVTSPKASIPRAKWRKLAKARGVDMPVTDAVNAVLEGKLAPNAAVEQLLSRDPKHER